MAAARLAKCGPWHRGGWDPIPERLPNRRSCRTGCDDDGKAWGPPAQLGEGESFVV